MIKFFAVFAFVISSVSFAQTATPTPSASVTPSPSPTDPTLVPTYRSIREIVFVAKCLQCHAAGEHEDDMPLDNYERMLAHGKLVVPNDLRKSKVVKEIENGKMPPRRSGIPPVTELELAAIKAWILNGAPKE